MKLTNTLRKTVIAFAATATLATGMIATEASAAGYSVNSSAVATGFPSYDQLNIRRWDASYSQKVGEVYRGHWVHVIRCKLKSGSDWCKINSGGVVGWVNGRYLRKNGYNFAERHPYH